MELAIIADSMKPVSTNPDPNSFESQSFGQEIVPTHTFENAPEIEVLLVPGGQSTRNPSVKCFAHFQAKLFSFRLWNPQ